MASPRWPCAGVRRLPVKSATSPAPGPRAAGRRHPALPVKTGDFSGAGAGAFSSPFRASRCAAAHENSDWMTGRNQAASPQTATPPNGQRPGQRQTRESHRRSLTSASTTGDEFPLTHAIRA
jgi:hypothetical protein